MTRGSQVVSTSAAFGGFGWAAVGRSVRSVRVRVSVEFRIEVKGNVKATDRSVRSTLASLRSSDGRGGRLYMSCGGAGGQQVPRAPSALSE